MNLSKKELAKYIDHTLLKPDATGEDIARVCDEAAEFGFASVCVNPSYIGFAASRLRGTGVNPCCVIGFPLGATLPETKAYEASAAIVLGAKEVDMVMNIGAAKSGAWVQVEKDIREVVNAASGRALVKVILETCLLTEKEKVKACKIAESAGADFVKTSTGFSLCGAKVEDIKLMRSTVSAGIGIKASGGIRDFETAVAMINAGATRIGTSSGINILEDAK